MQNQYESLGEAMLLRPLSIGTFDAELSDKRFGYDSVSARVRKRDEDEYVVDGAGLLLAADAEDAVEILENNELFEELIDEAEECGCVRAAWLNMRRIAWGGCLASSASTCCNESSGISDASSIENDFCRVLFVLNFH